MASPLKPSRKTAALWTARWQTAVNLFEAIEPPGCLTLRGWSLESLDGFHNRGLHIQGLLLLAVADDCFWIISHSARIVSESVSDLQMSVAEFRNA